MWSYTPKERGKFDRNVPALKDSLRSVIAFKSKDEALYWICTITAYLEITSEMYNEWWDDPAIGEKTLRLFLIFSSSHKLSPMDLTDLTDLIDLVHDGITRHQPGGHAVKFFSIEGPTHNLIGIGITKL